MNRDNFDEDFRDSVQEKVKLIVEKYYKDIREKEIVNLSYDNCNLLSEAKIQFPELVAIINSKEQALKEHMKQCSQSFTEEAVGNLSNNDWKKLEESLLQITHSPNQEIRQKTFFQLQKLMEEQCDQICESTRDGQSFIGLEEDPIQSIDFFCRCKSLQVPEARNGIMKIIRLFYSKRKTCVSRINSLINKRKSAGQTKTPLHVNQEVEIVMRFLKLSKSLNNAKLSSRDFYQEALDLLSHVSHHLVKNTTVLKRNTEYIEAAKTTYSVASICIDQSAKDAHALTELAKLVDIIHSQVKEDKRLHLNKPTVNIWGEANNQVILLIDQIERLCSECLDECSRVDLFHERLSLNTAEREQEFVKLWFSSELLKKTHGMFLNETFKRGQEKIVKIMTEHKQKVENVLEEAKSKTDWEKCQTMLVHLKLLSRASETCIDTATTSKRTDEFRKLVRDRIKQLRCCSDDHQRVTHLIGLQSMADNLDGVQETVHLGVSCYLDELNERNNRAIPKLGVYLEGFSNPLTKRILQDYSVFTGYMRRLFNEKIASVRITEVLDSLQKCKTTRYSKDPYNVIEEAYRTFRNRFESAIERRLHEPKAALNNLSAQVRITAANASSDASSFTGRFEITADMHDCIPLILGDMFAMWTLHNISSQTHDDKELLQPHPAQVVVIFRLLGLKQTSVYLASHLIQVLTGQGKSVVLAMTAATLALFGAEVSVALFRVFKRKGP